MASKVIEIVDGVARHPSYRMAEPVNFVLYEGEQLAILGPNGSGKTKLVNTIIGRYPLLMNEVKYDFGEYSHRMTCENIHYMAFRDSYGDADGSYYYQQRWHSQDVELSPTVRDVLPEEEENGEETSEEDIAIDDILDASVSEIADAVQDAAEEASDDKETYSDGYDIAQEVILFLCNHIGKKLGDLELDLKGKLVSIKTLAMRIVFR